jgi:hypothetical protein
LINYASTPFAPGPSSGSVPTSDIMLIFIKKSGVKKKILDNIGSIWLWRLCKHQFTKWHGKDFIDRFSPATGFSGLDKTERAVAHFCGGYLSTEDGDYLKSGGYFVKYLDYDWALNAK